MNKIVIAILAGSIACTAPAFAAVTTKAPAGIVVAHKHHHHVKKTAAKAMKHTAKSTKHAAVKHTSVKKAK